MRITMILLTCAAAACADLETTSTDQTEEPGDPSIYLADGAIDEDLSGDMVEVDLPVTEELARGMHRIRATDANMTLFRRACHNGFALSWDCPSNIDGRHAHFSHKRETGVNDTEVADNGGTFLGECVSLVKAATKNNATTSTWRPGANVFSGLPAGTAIATFPGGRYDGHTAILLSYVRSGGSVIGIRVADQNWLQRKVKRHVIRKSGSGVADANNYAAVLVP
jgi:hypothetical protein